MRETNKHIQFEVTSRFNPMAMFGGAPQAGDADTTNTDNDDDYVPLDEEGFSLLSQALGGG